MTDTNTSKALGVNAGARMMSTSSSSTAALSEYTPESTLVIVGGCASALKSAAAMGRVRSSRSMSSSSGHAAMTRQSLTTPCVVWRQRGSTTRVHAALNMHASQRLSPAPCFTRAVLHTHVRAPCCSSRLRC
jgi:hypothetical protein